MTVRQFLLHRWLEASRSPMFLMGVLEKALMVFTMLMTISVLFVAGYFVETLDKSAFPGVTSFTVLTLVLNILLLLDLVLRPLSAEKLEAPVRPYLFLMVPKNKLVSFIMFDYFLGIGNVFMFFSLIGLGWLVFLNWPYPWQSVSLVVYFLLMLVLNTNLKMITARLLLINGFFRFTVIGVAIAAFACVIYFVKMESVSTIMDFTKFFQSIPPVFGILFVVFNSFVFLFSKRLIARVLYIE
ncbi:hypothetical protein CLV98_12127 [Dyadobacter jejuensis]|uniref:Uncharacterized protein n=1 Tax=Dyadobacter jejuensis TaxID=1082580 RepID=A0A316A7R4_9BACT|nr:DUF5687 family protein [Dyadobacter jejuensis]PWJ53755.1 hypothetical protein CLV98_12127 [Dyadobacter jejuensis]